LELSHGPWFHWKRFFLDAFSRPMARLGATGRKHYPGLVLVLEHWRKRTHVHLLYFPTRSCWNSRVSPQLDDLYPKFNADSEAQVCFHCRGAFATPVGTKWGGSRQNGDSPHALVEKLRPHAAAINIFCAAVERLAEEKMLETRKLEGAHYSAMKQLREKITGATCGS
jgi:hypothetical protein